jgi:hypothetical protein
VPPKIDAQNVEKFWIEKASNKQPKLDPASSRPSSLCRTGMCIYCLEHAPDDLNQAVLAFYPAIVSGR